MNKLAVTSRSFSKNALLRERTLKLFPGAKFNDSGIKLSGAGLVEFLCGFESAITALEVFDDELLRQLPDLKVIGKFGVGLDMLDLNALHHHSVKLGWTAGVNRRSVSELVLASAISLLRQSNFASSELVSGSWTPVVGKQLTGCTFGIVGCGNIGKDVVELLKPYSCNILINDRYEMQNFCVKHNASQVSLDDLLQASDVVSLHLPLDDTTKNLISEEKLKLMNSSAVLLNFARGGIVDEDALLRMLEHGDLYGAALDVFSHEPPKNKALIQLKNVIATPHIGGSSQEAVLDMGMAALNGVLNPKSALSYKDL